MLVVEMPSKTRTKSAADLGPIVRVVMVSLLVAPVSAQGPRETWTHRDQGGNVRSCPDRVACDGIL